MIKNIETVLAGVLAETRAIVAESVDRDSALLQVCRLLENQVAYYDWVGFYLVDPAAERELVLGPYVGAETDHTRIAFGQGICGQAADSGETFVIQDVSQENNYLACSLTVKSEIVVPLFSRGRLVGELDIDSHVLAPFSDADRSGLEAIAAALAPLFI